MSELTQQTCRVCGCTDDNCAECVAATGYACWWVERDLCSRCGARRFIKMFKERFVPLVETGRKLQTVRPWPKRMPHVRDVIECRYWSGKPYRSGQFWCGEGRITRAAWVFISQGGSVTVGNRRLSEEETTEFARADGFETREEMIGWFQAEHGLSFTGIVIGWDLLLPVTVEGGRS